MLIEHQWAVPLRETIARAGGFRISDGFIDPFDLQAIGLVTAEEAESLDAMDSGPRPNDHRRPKDRVFGTRRVARRTIRRVVRRRH